MADATSTNPPTANSESVVVGGDVRPSQTSTAGTPRRNRRVVSGSSYQIISGERRVKGYPITRDELFTLGGLSVLASGFFGFGGNFVSRSFDLQVSIELSTGVAPEVIARWMTREYDYWYFGLVLLLFGIFAAIAGGAKIWSIIDSTRHPEE
jgi:hypothetical protein